MFLVIDATGKVQGLSAGELTAGEGQRVIQLAPAEWAAVQAQRVEAGEALAALTAAQQAVLDAQQAAQAAGDAYNEAGAALHAAFVRADASANATSGEVIYDEVRRAFAVRARVLTPEETAKAAEDAALREAAKTDLALRALMRRVNFA